MWLAKFFYDDIRGITKNSLFFLANPENATIEELKQVSRVGSNETATRCAAIQMLLAGADRQLVCQALLVTRRALRKWINRFNESGGDGLIVKKRPGKMAIINGQQAVDIAHLIDQPQQAERTFWTAKAFHGYISQAYQQGLPGRGSWRN